MRWKRSGEIRVNGFGQAGRQHPRRGVLVTYSCGEWRLARSGTATGVTKAMSAEQRSRAFEQNEEMKVYLANGVKPDAVGDMVLAAIRENRLYVHTDRSSISNIQERSKAQIDAMPPAR